jgi:hypothetical protein
MTYVSVSLRRQVIERAANCCEYCRLNRSDHILPFEIDHIVAEKHGGNTDFDNLCLSCFDCNKAKGSDIASADPVTGKATFLFHPRSQDWHEHFRLNGAIIEPFSPEGRVTLRVLQLNEAARVKERSFLLRLGRYPCHPQRRG